MTMRLPPSVNLPAFPLKSPTSPNFGLYFLTLKLYSMQLTNDAVSTTSQSASLITTSFEFRTYLISTAVLKVMRSAVQGIPFLSNPNASVGSMDSAIWLGKSVKSAFSGLKTGQPEAYQALASDLTNNPSKYAIGVLSDSKGKQSWALYIKGQNQASEMATVKYDTTVGAEAVATVS